MTAETTRLQAATTAGLIGIVVLRAVVTMTVGVRIRPLIVIKIIMMIAGTRM